VTRKEYAAEEKIRVVLDGLRGEHSIAELCRSEGIAESLYYSWSKEFLEAGKRRLSGDTSRAATSSEVKDLRRQAQDLKEVVAEQALELRLLKKSIDGHNEQRSSEFICKSIARAPDSKPCHSHQPTQITCTILCCASASASMYP
jgi:transposase